MIAFISNCIAQVVEAQYLVYSEKFMRFGLNKGENHE